MRLVLAGAGHQVGLFLPSLLWDPVAAGTHGTAERKKSGATFADTTKEGDFSSTN